MVTRVNRRLQFELGANIHPSYYQYLEQLEAEEKAPLRVETGGSRFGRNLGYLGVFLSGMLFSFTIISGPEPTSAAMPSVEVKRIPIVERIRVERHRHLRRVKEVELNIQRITKVLTYLHGAITEAVGEPSSGQVDDHLDETQPAADLPTATVIVPKANLRAAPDINSEAIATVSEGTRLVLETNRGEWTGVTTPSGEKAWIRTDLIYIN